MGRARPTCTPVNVIEALMNDSHKNAINVQEFSKLASLVT